MATPSPQATETPQTAADAEDLRLVAEQATREMRDALRQHGWLAVDKTGPQTRQAPHIRLWIPPRADVLRQVITGLERLDDTEADR